MSIGILIREEGEPLVLVRRSLDGLWDAKLRLDVMSPTSGIHRTYGRLFGPQDTREELAAEMTTWALAQAEQDREPWAELIGQGFAKFDGSLSRRIVESAAVKVLGADQPELTEDTLAEAWSALPEHRRQDGGAVLEVGARARLIADRIVRSEPPGPLYAICEVRLSAELDPDAWRLA